MNEKYPSIPWVEYFNRILSSNVSFVTDDEIVVVDVPSYITDLERLLEKTPKRVQANYVMWRVAASTVSYLNSDIRKRQLDYSTVVSGKF